jgi:chitinase
MLSNINYNTPTGKKSILFHTNWSTYGRNFQVSDIPKDVMDIYYCFGDVEANGNVISRDAYSDTDKRYTDSGIQPFDSWNDDNKGVYGNLGQFKKLKATRNFNLHYAIFGWTYSKYVSSAISTVNTRKNMIDSLITYFKKYDLFSGVSLDYEYPSNDGKNYGNDGNEARPEDANNFLLLVKELRKAFDSNGMDKYQISICCCADQNKVKFDVPGFVPFIDLFLLMTYDFHGFSGETVCLHHTNPRKSALSKFSCEGAADYFLSRGVPSNKICIGGAFYSRGYTNSDGFEKSGTGLSSDMSWEQGVCDFNSLPKAGATEYLDPVSKGAYSYDPVKRILNTYDNKESIIEKCKIVYEKNLAGIIIWENSGDKRDYNDPRNLTKVLRDNLTHGKPNGITTTSQPQTNPTTTPQTTTPTTTNPQTTTSIIQPPPIPTRPSIPLAQNTTNTTIVSPYFFTWAFDNSAEQKLTSLMQAKSECDLKAVTLAFIISGGDGIISNDVDNMISDVKAFINAGGYVTISFGGQAGTYIENSTNETAIFNSIDGLLQRTGVRSIDFDVEGSQLANKDMNIRRAKVLAKLQAKYPDLNTRITLPVMPYHNEWDLGGIPDIALDLLKTTVSLNAKVNTVNLMTMDYGDSYSTRTGSDLAISSVEETVKQLQTIDYFKNDTYKYIGICPMIGHNDDNNIFTVDDAKRVSEYSNKMGIPLISYWGLQRDRKEMGSVNDYSSCQKTDYEFYKNFNSNSILSNVPVKPPTNTTPIVTHTPVNTPTITPIPVTPTPTNVPIFNWSKTGNYKKGNKVKYQNVTYECLIDHVVTDTLPTQALWKVIETPTSNTQNLANWIVGSTYKKNDKVIYQSNLYECLLDHTVSDANWTPIAVPALWKKI